MTACRSDIRDTSQVDRRFASFDFAGKLMLMVLRVQNT
jgi:hypothetical protein